MHFIKFLGLLLLGFICVKHAKWLKENVPMQFGFAMSLFGPTGMYTFWKLFGLIIIIGSFYYLFNM